MKNLWVLAIGSFVMTGCIENKSTEAVKEDKIEVVSTSNEITNPPRVESPADVNLREGTAFLANNAKNEGVEVLESGVQLLELIPGIFFINFAAISDKKPVNHSKVAIIITP